MVHNFSDSLKNVENNGTWHTVKFVWAAALTENVSNYYELTLKSYLVTWNQFITRGIEITIDIGIILGKLFTLPFLSSHFWLRDRFRFIKAYCSVFKNGFRRRKKRGLSVWLLVSVSVWDSAFELNNNCIRNLYRNWTE